MFYFVYPSLANDFIKLGEMLTCVMTFDIILFDNCNSILTDKAESTFVVWDNEIFCTPFTVEYPSFVINFSLLSYRYFTNPEITFPPFP